MFSVAFRLISLVLNQAKNIEKLKGGDAIAVVCGQQLGLFGGPLYVFYKLVSIVEICKKIERDYQRQVVPVFLVYRLKDHGLDEISSITCPTKEGQSKETCS